MSQQGALNIGGGSGGSVVETLTGNTGGPVGPDATFNINVTGNNTTGINVVGMPGTNTLSIVGIQATTTQRGTVELATNAEAIAGTDISNAVTSAALSAKLGAQTLHGIAIGAGPAAPVNWTAAPTDGQLLIGDTGSDPVLANLTSTGGTITITNGPGTINLELSGGGVAFDQINVDSSTAPGTDPVLPTPTGQLTITGAQVATGVIGTNVIRTASLNPSEFTIQIQRSTAVGATDITKNGVSHFDSSQFAVDANGFVTITSAPGIDTINGDSGSATGSTVTIFSNVATQNAGSSVSFVNSGSTSTFNTTDISNNVIIGRLAGNATLIGNGAANNVGIGHLALTGLTSGSVNCVGGDSSGNLITSGSNNTAWGNISLSNLLTGDRNIAIGVQAGQGYTGAESSNIVIGALGTAAESNTLRIGTQGAGVSQVNRCFIAGITGVTVANVNIVTLNTSTGQLGAMSATGVGFTWTAIGASQTLVVGNGYFCTAGGALSLALPATSAVGDTIEVALDGSTSWTITQPNAATQIRIGSSQTTLGVGGSLASTSVGDSIRLVCQTANARWQVTPGWVGNITVV